MALWNCHAVLANRIPHEMQRGTSYCAELMRPIYCMLAPFLKTRKVKVDDTTFTAATPELGVAFQRAAAAARDASGLSVSMRLRLYGLYKQATAGDAAATAPEASVLDPTAQPKWRSWSKLRGMPRAEAMRLYVAAVDGDASEQGVPEPEIDPEEEAALELMGSGMGGGVMSMMAREDGDDDDDDDDDAAGGGALLRAARRGELARCEELLHSGEGVDAVDEEGHTALHLACDRGHLEIARSLVQRGAPLEAQNCDGMTALHMACACEHLEIATLLLNCGASAAALDSDGCTPPQLAPASLVAALRGDGLLR